MFVEADKYAPIWELPKAPPELHRLLEQKCQENIWLKKGGVPFVDDPFLELDSPYSFCVAEDIRDLELYFEHGNWSIRQGIVYKDLAFINQVNGGGEWWTLKKDGDSYIDFESITFKRLIESGEFPAYMDRLLKATPEQCSNLKY